MAPLPPGPYILTAINVSREKISISEHRVVSVQYQLLGTNWAECYSWFTDLPNSAWVWRDMVEEFDDLPAIVGRSFLFNVSTQKVVKSGRYCNRVESPLAEVLSMKEHMPG